jgi:hypothetical protein
MTTMIVIVFCIGLAPLLGHAAFEGKAASL